MEGLIGSLAGLPGPLVEYIEQLILVVGAHGHGLVADGAHPVDDLVCQLGLEGGHVVLREQLVHFQHTHTFQGCVDTQQVLQLWSMGVVLNLAKGVSLGLLNFNSDHFGVINKVNTCFLGWVTLTHLFSSILKTHHSVIDPW